MAAADPRSSSDSAPSRPPLVRRTGGLGSLRTLPDSDPGDVHLFPGQGDFSVGRFVRALHADRLLRAVAEDILARIDVVTAERGLPRLWPWLLGDCPPSGRDLLDAPPGTVQLMLYGAELTLHRAFVRSWGRPVALVGVSFGEIPAVTAAGVFTVEDGARVVHDLARVLVDCPGGLTVSACSEVRARVLIERAVAPEVVVGVVNDDGCVVLAGPVAELARVERVASGEGVPVTRLRLPFTSHHPALSAQADIFAAAVHAYPRSEPVIAVHSAVTGRAYADAQDVARGVAGCLARQARFPEALRQAAIGSTRLVEVGTGRALADSARRILPGARVHAPLGDAEFRWRPVSHN